VNLGSATSADARIMRWTALAAAAMLPTAALAQATAPVAPVAPIALTPSPLASIPGVTIRYYDVAGSTIPAIRASMAAQRPKDPVTAAPVPSSSSWSIGVNTKKATTGKACKVTGATATFKGEVVLPRLVGVEAVPAPVRAQWQKFVASIEQQQADALRQPYQRIGEVEAAVMASTCANAGEAAKRSIAEITRAAPPPAVAAPPTP
jgi:predicted secreted Zn-dependent protease